jgi:hypothetical protein
MTIRPLFETMDFLVADFFFFAMLVAFGGFSIEEYLWRIKGVFLQSYRIASVGMVEIFVVQWLDRTQSDVIHKDMASVGDPLWGVGAEDHPEDRETQRYQLGRIGFMQTGDSRDW